MLEFTEHKLHVRLLTPLLGTVAGNQDLWSEFIATKAPPTINDIEDSGTEFEVTEDERPGHTTFYTDLEGHPIIRSYQIKGALKEWGNIVRPQLHIANLRHHIDTEVFVYPKTTILAEMVDGTLARPLRARTPKGPRVTLVSSDKIDPPKDWVFDLRVFKGSQLTKEVLNAVCEFGAYIGIGQWRTGEYGQVEAWVE